MADKKDEFKVQGYEAVEKVVKPHSKTSGRVYLPAIWEGCRVLVVRKDPIKEDDEDEITKDD